MFNFRCDTCGYPEATHECEINLCVEEGCYGFESEHYKMLKDKFSISQYSQSSYMPNSDPQVGEYENGITRKSMFCIGNRTGVEVNMGCGINDYLDNCYEGDDSELLEIIENE